MPCLSTDDVLKYNHTRLQNFTQCAGLNKIKLEHYITQSIPILAPSINISQHQYRILRVKDFMVRCPRCAIKSFFGWRDRANENEEYEKPERCAREIQTFSPGWPQHARFCDEEDEHQMADFCRIHELLRDKLSVKMEQISGLDYDDVFDEFGSFDDFY
ncbi:unnamed protein product [Onchocerca ochengi]|uniref:Uncharacterized protein n=1 Tax=Onchocerca ochengi TaxID=42157 RepID=A0A3P7KF50_ONCOC|nr:unnamed protein product [Onchocerca ochengi]